MRTLPPRLLVQTEEAGNGTARATIDDLVERLRRIEGAICGIQQMLTDGRGCRDVVTQISPARMALDQTGFILVASGLTYCLTYPEAAARNGYDIDGVQKMFMKLD